MDPALCIDLIERHDVATLASKRDETPSGGGRHFLAAAFVMADVARRASHGSGHLPLRDTQPLTDLLNGTHADILAPLGQNSNAPLVCLSDSGANDQEMSESDDKRGKVSPENIEESRRLQKIWNRELERRRNDDAESQAKFGEKYGIGNQAAVGFFLNAKTALSAKAAAGFARGLGCTIDDFSPRLAEELRMHARHLRQEGLGLEAAEARPNVTPIAVTLHEAVRIFGQACAKADPLRFKLVMTALGQLHQHPEMAGDAQEQIVQLLTAPGKAQRQG